MGRLESEHCHEEASLFARIGIRWLVEYFGVDEAGW